MKKVKYRIEHGISEINLKNKNHVIETCKHLRATGRDYRVYRITEEEVKF